MVLNERLIVIEKDRVVNHIVDEEVYEPCLIRLFYLVRVKSFAYKDQFIQNHLV